MKRSKMIPAGMAIAGALILQGFVSNAQSGPLSPVKPAPGEDIRPFQVHVPEAALTDLRKRITSTRWPDKETDQSQGIELVKLQGLIQYWGTTYDWRKAEAKLNALPQFKTRIDSLDIYFIHVRSKQPHALPLIITHGWPGSIFELLDIIGPLTNPTAYGGKAEDAFDVVIPSMPGYGFSDKPAGIGWNPEHIAKAWDILMKRLGYTQYVAQGGDWGALVTQALGRQAPAGLLGIHVNLPAVVPPEIIQALNNGEPAPAGLSDKERSVYQVLDATRKKGALAYVGMMGARPQTVGYGITDSPTGLAAWLLGHPGFSQWAYGNDPAQLPSKDEVLDDITLYWLTNTATSSGRLYWENKGRSPFSADAQMTSSIPVPVGVTVFGEDSYKAPETWARRAYPKLSYFHEVAKGGHFASWEQPLLFSAEMRAAFKSFR